MNSGLLGALALLLVIAGAPLAFAIDCNSISQANYNTCLEILSSNLTSLEKELIISNLDYGKKFYPDHDFIYQRNANLQISSAPNGVNYYNGKFIKYAWLSIFTAMPSVLYKGNLLVPNKTTILTGFNYQIQAPSNYYSPGYPYTSNGDCKRLYTQTSNIAENKIYFNNNYQGSGKLVQVNINSDSEIKAVYTIDISYSVSHYTWHSYCCKRDDDGYCIKTCRSCDYSYTNSDQETVSLEDYLNASYFKSNLFANITTLASYSSSTKIQPNFSNSIALSFQDSYFDYYDFIYEINYSKSPYYVYTLQASSYNQEKTNNIFKDKDSIIVNNINNCTIKAWDFFKAIQKSCFIEAKPNNFNIKTNKLSYKINETINISIYPQNLSVNITYANQSKIARGNTTFIAQELENKIIAKYNDYEAERVIFIQNREKFALIYNLSVFGFLNYAIYCILRKYLGGFI